MGSMTFLCQPPNNMQMTLTDQINKQMTLIELINMQIDLINMQMIRYVN